MEKVIQSAINVSTASEEVIEEMIQNLRSLPMLIVADYSSDQDHNRSVITLLGNEVSLLEAVMRIFRVAIEKLDISRHQGEHPRIGAVDVVPFTPWWGSTMEECRVLAWRVGERVAEEFAVPVYFYAEASRIPEHRDLSFLRRGGYELLKEEIDRVPDRQPDLGPRTLHPTLGAVAIGARGPLIAFNVNLDTQDVEVARYIAQKLRGEKGGLRFVKAIGVSLKSRNLVQVSMNLLDFRKSTLYQALELVRLEAQRFGVQVKGAEIIGLVPLEALVDVASLYLGIPGLKVTQVLEYHLLEAQKKNL
ncbi:MAG: glutamate formimidoyltransferase [Candidatus Caldatribacteriaceae bacterium]